MRTTESVVVDAPRRAVFPVVADLDRYPEWLPLVHSAALAPAAPGDPGPAWTVELRARVGPFARSKQLRMVRTSQGEATVTFERAEVDGRDHARWLLRADLTELGAGRTEVKMHLAYDGRLWPGAVLEHVLADEIRRGREGLSALVAAG